MLSTHPNMNAPFHTSPKPSRNNDGAADGAADKASKAPKAPKAPKALKAPPKARGGQDPWAMTGRSGRTVGGLGGFDGFDLFDLFAGTDTTDTTRKDIFTMDVSGISTGSPVDWFADHAEDFDPFSEPVDLAALEETEEVTEKSRKRIAKHKSPRESANKKAKVAASKVAGVAEAVASGPVVSFDSYLWQNKGTDAAGNRYGEDLKPMYKTDGIRHAIVVGDGHGGRTAVEAAESQRDHILDVSLQMGARAGLDAVLKACADVPGGAMFSVIVLWGSQLTIASVGDCACYVYADGTLLHEQKHHDISHFNEQEERQRMGIVPSLARIMGGKPRHRQPWVNDDGLWTWAGPVTDKDPETQPEAFAWYFRYPNGSLFATCAGAGHKTASGALVGMAPIVSVVEVPRKFHLICGSDGLGDVCNAQETVLCDGAHMGAQQLAQMMDSRWKTGGKSTWGADFAGFPNNPDDISVATLRRE